MNQSYEPLSLCTVKKAIILLFLSKAEMINTKDKLSIHSASMEYPWPSVIRLKKYVRAPFRKTILSRKNILKRDNHKCAYCGRSDLPLTMDHIIPKSLGGQDSWDNIVTACSVCNNKKGNRLIEDAGMKLLFKPYTPNRILFIKNSVNRIDENWKKFLFQK